MNVLLLMSLIDSQSIPRILLDFQSKKTVVDQLLHEMKKYYLITDSITTDGVDILSFSHRSIQEICQLYLRKTLGLTQGHALVEKTSKSFEGFMQSLFEQADFLHLSYLKPHCRQLMKNPLLDETTNSAIGALLSCVQVNECIVDTDIKDLLEESIKKLKKNHTRNKLKIIQAIAYLGEIHKEIGQYEKAKQVLEEGLVFCNQEANVDSVNKAIILLHLGNVYRFVGDYAQAMVVMAKGNNIFKKFNRHVPLALSQMYLGVINLDLGKFHDAQEKLQKAHDTLMKHGRFQAAMSWILAFQGRLYIQTGEWEKAQKVLEEGLAIAHKSYEENSTYIGWFFCYLGILHKELGNYLQAIKLLEKGKKIYENKHIKNYVYFHTLRCLGNIYADMGQYNQARELLTLSHDLREKNYGTGHIQTAFTFNSLGDLALKEGDTSSSENLIQKALKLFQAHNHPEAYMAFESLARICLLKASKKGEKERSEKLKQEAYDYLNQALILVKAAFSNDSSHIDRINEKLLKLGSKLS